MCFVFYICILQAVACFWHTLPEFLLVLGLKYHLHMCAGKLNQYLSAYLCLGYKVYL